MFVGEFLQGAEEEPGHDAEWNSEKGRAAGEANHGHEEARGAWQRDGAEGRVVKLLEVLVAGAQAGPQEPGEGEESDDAHVHHEAADVAVGGDEIVVAGAAREEERDAVTAFAKAAAEGIFGHEFQADFKRDVVAPENILEFEKFAEAFRRRAGRGDGGDLDRDENRGGKENEIDEVAPIPRDQQQPDAERDERGARPAEDHAVRHWQDAEGDDAAFPFGAFGRGEERDGEDDDVGERAAKRGGGDEGGEGAHLPRAAAAGVEAGEVARRVVGIGVDEFFDFVGRLAHAVNRDDHAEHEEDVEVALHLRQVAREVIAEAKRERGEAPAAQRRE